MDPGEHLRGIAMRWAAVETEAANSSLGSRRRLGHKVGRGGSSEQGCHHGAVTNATWMIVHSRKASERRNAARKPHPKRKTLRALHSDQEGATLQQKATEWVGGDHAGDRTRS